ncbi:hypothetical protein PR202_ga10379 [Eleusine coracana subsp. coracana]|uniref:Uncharacterized protein n=1 Tax=Eleusine coracana subsp. coracana TaxID=191504 RepID=A0AAV5C6I3_ELECO|nr:hypothetical protein QOZ80_1AG0025890 [Eleusine coracana subsp. coracana]GJM93791.1 hypothetical protein PR202_ga10379 [Eleusine coracana subsp. coracana]
MAASMVRICAGEPAVRKGPWTLEEDLVLVSYITEHGEGSWDSLARAAGLNRNGKSCRLRWLNYLRPGVRRGSITPAEDAVIRELQAAMGNKWSRIAKHLPGRTDNEIKNYWRTRIQKRPPQQQQTRRKPSTTTMVAEAVSEGASSSSSGSASQDDGSCAAAGDRWFMQLKTEQPAYYCQNVAMAAATGTIKSEGASSALASQDSCSAEDCWYTQASYPYYSQLSSAADHLGTAGVDASSATQFFSSEFSDSFWNTVNNFWETRPVKGAF